MGNKKRTIETERERLREDLLAIPIANRFYRLKGKKQKLHDDLIENLWTKVPLKGMGRRYQTREVIQGVLDKRVIIAIINQLLDSTMKEIEPLKLEIVTEKRANGPVNREEAVQKIISLLTHWLDKRAMAFGPKRTNQR